MRIPNGLYVIAAFFIIVFAVVQLIDANNIMEQHKRDFVYQVCNSARQEVSGESEEECGKAQDHTNTEFLCEARNSLATNRCWVENK